MLNLPTPQQESWKFTHLARAVEQLHPTPPVTSLAELEACLPIVSGPQLVFHNGTLVKELSTPESLPTGLTLTRQPTALPNTPLDALDELPTPHTHHLHAATQPGAVLHLIHIATGTPGASTFALHVDADAHLTLINHHVAPPGTATWHHQTFNITQSTGSHLTFAGSQSLPPAAVFSSRTRMVNQPNSHTVAAFCSATAAALHRHEVHAQLTENCHFSHTGLTLARTAQHADTTLTVRHIGENNQTVIRQRNLLEDTSHAVFQGKFLVEKSAQKTNAYMHCHNLLLSDSARTSHKPELEIYADDVKCSHGAATGGLNPQQLFYLQARGLTPQAARALLVGGFAEEFIAHFPTAIQPLLHTHLQTWLNGPNPSQSMPNFGELQGEWLHEPTPGTPLNVVPLNLPSTEVTDE